MNSIGILSGPGIGRLLAHWIVYGKPNMDVTSININRFYSYHNTYKYRNNRVTETLGNVYKCHYPNYSYQTGRNIKKSVLYESFKKQNAYFKEISGWESADFFIPKNIKQMTQHDSQNVSQNEPQNESQYSQNVTQNSQNITQNVSIDNSNDSNESFQMKYSFQREKWFDYWKLEHNACRNDVLLMDMSFMSKFMVTGRDAGETLNYLSTANINDKLNTITYTQWLDNDGQVQADITITKLSDMKFLVVVTDTMTNQVETWMKYHLNPTGEKHVFVTDVTSSYTQINLQGPNSRQLLSQLTDYNMSDESFPYRMSKEISIGYNQAICARITYVGELGYELYVPTEQALSVYETIMSVQPNIQHGGLKSLGSLRLEKGM